MNKLVVLVLLLSLFGCGEKEKDYKKEPITENSPTAEDVRKEIEREKQRILDSIKEAERIALENSPIVQERKKPLKYCKIERLEKNSNFWGTKTTIHAYVKITSKYTEYKDMELKVQYLSQTGSVIGQELYTRYDYFQPNHSYKIGIDLREIPKDVANYNVVVNKLVYSKQYK